MPLPRVPRPLENVPRCVEVPVQNKTAGATMHPLPQRLVHDGTATGALLRRSTGLHTEHRSTSFFRFVLQRPQEVPPRGVRDAPMQASLSVALDHVVDVEVLDRDEAEPLDERPRGLEMEVLALTVDLLVVASEDGACLAATVAPTELAAEPPLRSRERCFCRTLVTRVRDGAAVAERREMRESDVDADLARSCCQRRIRRHIVAGEQDVPARRLPAKGRSLDGSPDRTM